MRHNFRLRVARTLLVIVCFCKYELHLLLLTIVLLICETHNIRLPGLVFSFGLDVFALIMFTTLNKKR